MTFKRIVFILILLGIYQCLAQNKNVSIYFDNGSKLEVFKGFLWKKYLIVNREENSRKERMPYDSIRRVHFRDKNGIITAYEKHKVKGLEKVVFFQVLLEGRVSILKPHVSFGAYGGFFTPIGENVYLKKNEDEKATFFYKSTKGPLLTNYKKIILKHFGECKALIAKLDRKELKPMQTFAVVNFYNNNCF